MSRWLQCAAAVLVVGFITGLPAAQARTGGTGAQDGLPVDAVEIRRTTDGIAHVRAHSWQALGRGIGYVQAEDALCTLAEAFVTYEGRRSWFFGPEARPQRASTFGRPKNLELDFFFRAFADPQMVARYRAQQPAELGAVIEGYAAGYNRYLRQLRSKAPAARATHGTCARAAWLREISADDLYRRLYAAQVAGGYARFIAEIVNAAPPQDRSGRPAAASQLQAPSERLAHRMGEQEGVGSNALAFGREATGERESVLFGNPHWFWGGPDRFYQMHLTIPGRLDVAGVGFLGVPLVMIGFNGQVAWSHTVSTARRFGLFDLTLDEADPTQVWIDGQREPMLATRLSIDVRRNGRPQRITRTLYRTRHGPVVDLGAHHAALGWRRDHVLAIRDVNAQNFRVFRTFFEWNQATSLDEFIAIQRRELALPWVNTVAIGKGDGRVWYGDVGAVPNVPDDLWAACATERSQGFARLDPFTPVLDGSRSGCDWRTDPRAAQPGALPAQALPGLLREDYVANMNDSYWLANVHQPLEGYPAVMGGERQALSLRGRLGHRIAAELLATPARSATALAARVRSAVLVPRAASAEWFKAPLLAEACAQHRVEVAVDGGPVTGVDLMPACRVLRAWSGLAEVDARGVLLWEAFWTELQKGGGDRLYDEPFAVAAPLDTPRAPWGGDGVAARALGAAVLRLTSRGQALDAPLGQFRFVRTRHAAVPVYGGCSALGYFTVACSEEDQAGLGPDALANSYLQVVTFGPAGVQAHTLLAHGQHEQALLGGRGAAPVLRYAHKAWLRFPFDEADIAADPQLRRTVLRPERAR